MVLRLQIRIHPKVLENSIMAISAAAKTLRKLGSVAIPELVEPLLLADLLAAAVTAA